MERNKSQIILLDKNGLETVAKALSSGCWTLSESGNFEISGFFGTSNVRGNAPQLTLAQGNVRPVTQVSGSGGSANSSHPVTPERSPTFQHDNSQVTTLTELGKKLVAAAKVGNTSQVRRLMAIGAPFASDGPIGMTPLHLAAQNGHYETCDRLLCAGMNKDARNKVEKTPLHLAAMEGHTDIVSLLVKTGANINACDMLKMTALHWACDRGHASIVRLLLKQHAQTDIANKFSKTPLHLAVENGHENIILLLQNGISCKEEEAVAVESISLDMTHDLDSLPVVCKTEEVHTEELLVEEICESSSRSTKGSQRCKEEEDIPSVDSELPHSIMADDADDQNISVLATLAELAQATSKGTENNVDMSSATALELLKAQAALLPIDDSSTLVTSAVAHGQTLHLTEAGRQALKLIKQELPLLPSNTLPQESMENEDKVNKKSRLKSTNSESKNTASYEYTPAQQSCLPGLLPSSDSEVVEEEREEEQQQQVTQIITLSPEQYAALTGGTNGPIILQVLPSSAEEQDLNEINKTQSPPTAKRQKVMQLVTRVGQGSSSQNQAVAKVSGQVLSVDLPSVDPL